MFRSHGQNGFLFPLALMIGATPAICEELLFRGYIQTRLVRSLGPLLGVGIASFLFAAFHLDLVHVIAVFPLGRLPRLGHVAKRFAVSCDDGTLREQCDQRGRCRDGAGGRGRDAGLAGGGIHADDPGNGHDRNDGGFDCVDRLPSRRAGLSWPSVKLGLA